MYPIGFSADRVYQLFFSRPIYIFRGRRIVQKISALISLGWSMEILSNLCPVRFAWHIDCDKHFDWSLDAWTLGPVLRREILFANRMSLLWTTSVRTKRAVRSGPTLFSSSSLQMYVVQAYHSFRLSFLFFLRPQQHGKNSKKWMPYGRFITVRCRYLWTM